jgi:hypothetical protein
VIKRKLRFYVLSWTNFITYNACQSEPVFESKSGSLRHIAVCRMRPLSLSVRLCAQFAAGKFARLIPLCATGGTGHYHGPFQVSAFVPIVMLLS